ncbi:VQ domain-containing protein [Heracleum sosnowskyi]|uniref:VQ domain-containing protein n=1 Tax=Heracleum sosnowskyi TaxID=360622 RepID=A0AAD8GN60_9APIA|nr:VQ domain-containing protein [Heracleum sosnowskyi]
MDSANSGSMQSSSGGDEEYDSSSHPHDNYLLNPQTNTLNHLANPNPSNFLYSNNNYTNNNILHNPFSHSPSTSNLYNNNNIQDFWSTNPQNDQTIQTSYTPSNQQPSNQSINLDRPLSNSLPQPDHQQSSVSKNPKKRTRASRRAPTTVLTTDTSNFRQMVQEFTGIPAPPFSTATSAFSRRLDLFGRGESLIYPLRPSAQKVANIQPSIIRRPMQLKKVREICLLSTMMLNIFDLLMHRMFSLMKVTKDRIDISSRVEGKSES